MSASAEAMATDGDGEGWDSALLSDVCGGRCWWRRAVSEQANGACELPIDASGKVK